MTTNDSSSRGPTLSSDLHGHQRSIWCTYMHAGKKKNEKTTVERLSNISVALTGLITLHERVSTALALWVVTPSTFYVLRKVIVVSQVHTVRKWQTKEMCLSLKFFSKQLPSNLQYPESCFQEAGFHSSCTKQPKRLLESQQKKNQNTLGFSLDWYRA